jgi:hypothetical protein
VIADVVNLCIICRNDLNKILKKWKNNKKTNLQRFRKAPKMFALQRFNKEFCHYWAKWVYFEFYDNVYGDLQNGSKRHFLSQHEKK